MYPNRVCSSIHKGNETYERRLWDTDPDVIDGLKDAYLEMEAWIKEQMGDVMGDIQGGSIDIVTMDNVEG